MNVVMASNNSVNIPSGGWHDVVARIMAPQRCLIPRSCENVRLHSIDELRLQVELSLLIT